MPERCRVVESAGTYLESPPSDEESDAGREENPGVIGYEQLAEEDDGDESDDEAPDANGWHALSEIPGGLPEGQQEGFAPSPGLAAEGLGSDFPLPLDDFSRRYIARLAGEAAAEPSSNVAPVLPAHHSHPAGVPGSPEEPPLSLGSSHSTAVSREGTASGGVEVLAGSRGSSTNGLTGNQDYTGHLNGGPVCGPSGVTAEGLSGDTGREPVHGLSCDAGQVPAGEVCGGSAREALGEPGGESGSGVNKDAMEMTAERKTAILGAMKNFTLPYFPPWAVHVPEDRWVGALRRRSSSGEDPGNT